MQGGDAQVHRLVCSVLSLDSAASGRAPLVPIPRMAQVHLCARRDSIESRDSARIQIPVQRKRLPTRNAGNSSSCITSHGQRLPSIHSHSESSH